MVNGSNIYVTGLSNSDNLDDLWRFDIDTLTWFKLSPEVNVTDSADPQLSLGGHTLTYIPDRKSFSLLNIHFFNFRLTSLKAVGIVQKDK